MTKQPWEKSSNWWKGSQSSIRAEDISKLSQPRDSVRDLLEINDLDMRYLMDDESIKPYAIVTLSRVKDKGMLETEEQEIAKIGLHDLSGKGKAHCLGIGRFPENFFRPYVDDTRTDEDRCVSREHGLVLLAREDDRLGVKYYDIGTERKGSTNGTWIDDKLKVRNIIMSWDENTYLGIGMPVIPMSNSQDKFYRRFRLRYALVGEEAKDVRQ